MFRILFVCTGNTCRSPMAQALLLQKIQSSSNGEGGDFQVWSAGIFARRDLPASPEAIAAMREEGLDLSCHRALPISDNLVGEAELILTMTSQQRDYLVQKYPDKSACIYTLNEFAENNSGEITDPYGLGQEAYRQTLAQMKLIVDRLFNRIRIKMG
ncbi:MAG: low molecular weight protein arginine phosphatase [Syntrophomonadaceae bacterium]|nr:low molecular weight protein arginine phosphatase [Syntrophomonadaceae bacterium]